MDDFIDSKYLKELLQPLTTKQRNALLEFFGLKSVLIENKEVFLNGLPVLEKLNKGNIPSQTVWYAWTGTTKATGLPKNADFHKAYHYIKEAVEGYIYDINGEYIKDNLKQVHEVLFKKAKESNNPKFMEMCLTRFDNDYKRKDEMQQNLNLVITPESFDGLVKASEIVKKLNS